MSRCANTLGPLHARGLAAMRGLGITVEALRRLAPGKVAGFAVIALCLSQMGAKVVSAANYSPQWNAVCALGSELTEGCAAVRAREIVDAAAYPWSAIGRINIADVKLRSHCTGVLIGERLVLTAAHCLYMKRTKKWVRANRIHFVAGFQRGEYVGHSRAARYLLSEAHDVTGTRYRHRPEDDWALVVLHEPLGARAGYLGWAALDHAGLERALRSGARIALAGYPAIREFAISADMNCTHPRLHDTRSLLVHRCAAMQGDSGAPLLLLQDGAAIVVAILGGVLAKQDDATSVSVPLTRFYRTILGALGGTDAAAVMNGLAGRPGMRPRP